MGQLEAGIFNDDNRSLKSIIVRLLQEVNGRLSFGHPDETATDVSNGRLLNIEGAWLSVSLEAAGGTIDCEHNLDVPTTTVGANSALPANVRWIIFGIEYGDKDGGNAAPAAPAAFQINIYRKVDEAMTRDSIRLRYLVTGIVPSATAPVTVTFFFTKAVN